MTDARLAQISTRALTSGPATARLAQAGMRVLVGLNINETRLGRIVMRALVSLVVPEGEDVGAHVGTNVCPVEMELSFRRQDIVTKAVIGAVGQPQHTYEDAEGLALYGAETWRTTDLICSDPAVLPILAKRVLRTRRYDVAPRVEAVLFNAATGDEVVDLLCFAADPLIPSRWQVDLEQSRGRVFSRQMFVTGVRHVIDRDHWECRVALDLAWPFAVANDFHWDGHDLSDVPDLPAPDWGIAQWGRAIEDVPAP